MVAFKTGPEMGRYFHALGCCVIGSFAISRDRSQVWKLDRGGLVALRVI